MPSKRRCRTGITTRRRKRTQEFPSQLYERNIEKSYSDIRTIPDQTFGKIYSTQVLEEIPSPNPSSVITPDIIRPTRKNKITKKRTK